MGDKSKFLGDTKGNRTNPPCQDLDEALGSGDKHSTLTEKPKFLGPTKGNRDLPPERSSGVSAGPRHVAGGSNAGKPASQWG